jgi:hypothetical protein
MFDIMVSQSEMLEGVAGKYLAAFAILIENWSLTVSNSGKDLLSPSCISSLCPIARRILVRLLC